MVNLQITEEADAVLESAARRAGMSKQEFAEEIILAHMEDESLPLTAFTPQQTVSRRALRNSSEAKW